MKLPAFILLVCAASAQPAAPPLVQPPLIQPPLIQQPQIQQRLESLSRNLAERRAILEHLFREVGCDGPNLYTQKVPGSKEPNVVCMLPAETDDAAAIVVGGHFDLVDAGSGAVDDWSGAVLLPSLYESLKRAPHKHTFIFVAFAAEEEGLFGSSEYVKRLSKTQKAGIRAMINLECLGLASPKVWASRADKHLFAGYESVAKTLGMQVEIVNVDGAGDDDSRPFLNAKIPVLTVHSTTPQNISILHSPRDQLSAIHPADYYATYRLMAAYLAFLDGWVL